MVVWARQSFQFLIQIIWFFGNNRALSKLGIGFFITWLVLPNDKKSSL